MFKTLFAKLVSVLAAISVVMSLIMVEVLQYFHHSYHLELTQNAYRSLAENLARDSRLAAQQQKISDPDGSLDRVTQVNRQFVAYVLDGSGAVLQRSSADSPVRRSKVSLDPIRRFLSGTQKFPLLGDDPANEKQSVVFSAAKLDLPDSQAGYLYVVLNGESTSAEGPIGRAYSLQESTWLVVGGIVAALVAGLVMFRIITLPVRRLRRAMEAFQSDGFDARATYRIGRHESPSDEINRLGEIYNSMAERISAQIESLKRVDESRRELFANISHDLRTPLVSLQGYVETLLIKGESLSSEERRTHLETALRQSRQLSLLVHQLMELAQLDSPEFKISPEPFPLPELVQDVLQEMSSRIESKGIRVEFPPPAEIPLVIGDIGLIERVVENILENALRHTPQRGSIELAIRRAPKDGIELEVADSGPGIDNKDLPRIFDRFFRADAARSESSINFGLGLAIAQQIVSLHGGTIRAANRPEGGAVFSISLPAQ